MTAATNSETTIEIKGRPGWPSSRGAVLAILGPEEHPHFRVRWEDGHVSLYYPDDRSHYLLHGAGR